MKSMRLFWSLFIVLLSFPIFGQESSDLPKKNEFKVNGLYLILGGLEVDYETIINEESSFGISVAYIFEEESQWKWGITPHYRLFFGKQPAAGFFLEGHGAIFGFEEYYYDDFPTSGGSSTQKNSISAGIGLAVGGKFKTSRDVVVEINGGFGRIFSNDNFDSIYPRFGINIGKRF